MECRTELYKWKKICRHMWLTFYTGKPRHMWRPWINRRHNWILTRHNVNLVQKIHNTQQHKYFKYETTTIESAYGTTPVLRGFYIVKSAIWIKPIFMYFTTQIYLTFTTYITTLIIVHYADPVWKHASLHKTHSEHNKNVLLNNLF